MVAVFIRFGVSWLVAASALMPAAARPLVAERVLIVMRHGVRSPTKDPPMPASIAAEPWSRWAVPPGYLTQHGERAMELLGAADRQWLASRSILPGVGCPASGQVEIVADSDERTIASAVHWVGGLAQGCPIAIRHKPEGTSDPLFSPLERGGIRLDTVQAVDAVRAALGRYTLPQVEARYRASLKRLDSVLCGREHRNCGVSAIPTALKPVRPNRKVGLEGALDLASTAGQIFLLEYAEGKPLTEVGWGRVHRADVRTFSEFHSLEYRLTSRLRPIASANLALLTPMFSDFLFGEGKSAVMLVSGHDTQIASLAGLLGAHWQVPGAAVDDPVPGGAVILEMLRDDRGHEFVEAFYRSQSLDQLRALSVVTRRSLYWHRLAVPHCHARGSIGLCTATQFRSLLKI